MHLHTGAAEDGPRADTSQESSRAAGYRERVEGRLGQISGRLNALIDERGSAFEPIRKYPLVAVGVAFSIGLALASSRTAGERHWMIERPRRRLRTLLLGTATAALVSELHNLAETDERIGKLLGAYLGDLPEGDDDYEEYEAYEDYEEDDDDDELPPLR